MPEANERWRSRRPRGWSRSGRSKAPNMTSDDPGLKYRAPQADGATQPKSGAAPWWLYVCVVILFVAVLIVGGLVVGRFTTRDLAAARARDARLPQLERAVNGGTADLETRLRLAYTYQQNSLYREALREYEQVLKTNPDNIRALYNKGLVELETGKNRAAERSLTRVLELSPAHALAAYSLGRHYVDSGEYERALAISILAADAHPDDADLQYTVGLALEKLGRFTEASARFEAALELVPGMPDALSAMKRLEGAR